VAGTLNVLLRRAKSRNDTSRVRTLCAQSVEYLSGSAIDDHRIKKPAGTRPANDGAGSQADRAEILEQRWKIT
jgi:hypothetical protein